MPESDPKSAADLYREAGDTNLKAAAISQRTTSYVWPGVIGMVLLAALVDVVAISRRRR